MSVFRVFGRAHPAVGATFALLFAPGLAEAGEVAVTATGGTVVVVIDGLVAGPAPLARDLSPGRHELAFRASEFGVNLFTQRVEVPEEGTVDVSVDLGQMTASVRARPAAPPPPASASAPAAGAPKSAPSPSASAPPSPPAPPAPPRPTGDLYVSTSEPGARIFVDGQPVETPSPTLLSGVAVGKRVVEARTECARGKAEVQVSAQVIARAELAMTTGSGALLVSSEPASAQVLLDGKPVGVTPITIKDVTCGAHELELRVLGYHPDRRSLRVPAFEVTTVKTEMEKERFGTLVVAPYPLEASVSLDGVAVGAGPRTFEKVAAGEHTLRVALDGFDTDERAVDVAPDVVTRIDVELLPTVLTDDAPPAPSKPKLPIGRLALNGGVSVGAAVLGGLAVSNYLGAAAAYEEWLTIPGDGAADIFWAERVQPQQTAALGLGVAGGLALAGATALWITTDWDIGVGPGTVELRGNW